MAENESSRKEPTRQLIERLDHLEDVLRMQTARLHTIEQHLGINFQPRPHQQNDTPAPRDEATPPTPSSSAHPSRDGQNSEKLIVELPTGAASNFVAATPAPDAPAAGTPSDGGPESANAAPYATSGETSRESSARTGGAWETLAWEGARREEARETGRDARAEDEARNWLDVETLIGGSWFNWIGVLAIAFGVAFFLKYAWNNQWIGPTARVLLGAAAGLGALAGGEIVRRRGLRQYAYVVSGGGILVLYLSVYAAFDFKLIGQLLAVVLMIAVTAAAVLLSVRYDALPIAILGLLGGFLTPILLSTGRDNQAGLFGYIALLDAGMLALAYYKSWRSINYMSFLLTLVMFVGWLESYYAPPKLWLTIFFLVLFFLLFSALAILHNVLKKCPAQWFDISLIITNATFFFGVSYGLLDREGFGSGLGSFALIVSAFFVLLYYFAYSRHRADGLLIYSYLGAAVTFFTMAVAIQLDQHWVTIAWAMEALMLTWVGLRSDTKAPRHAALVVLAIAVAHWVSTDMRDFAFNAESTFVPLLNRRAASCAALVGACAAMAWLYRRGAEKIEESERAAVITLMILAANALAFTLLSLDVNDYFEQRISRLAIAQPEAVEPFARLENTRQFSLSAMWTLYAATALVLGVVRRFKPLRIAALLLLAVTILKVVAFDSTYYDAAWHTLVFNHTFVAFALIVMALAAAAKVYAGADHVAAEERAAVITAAIAVANLLALTALSAEALGYFERAQALVAEQPGRWGEVARLENSKQFALTVIWTLYAAAAIAFGVVRRRKIVRLAGLGLLAVTAIKVLSVDMLYSAASWHALIFNQTFAAFVFLVGALGVVVRLYARGEGIDEEERVSVLPCLIAAANLLAVVGLSAEAWGYFEARINEASSSGLFNGGLLDLRLAQQLSLSVIWTIYGGVMLLVGIKRGSRLLRVMALMLLSLTTLKVFFWDLASLDRIYRIISFIVLGAILLGVSYIYQK
ncbi:MAG TPA: DUF2339 domain-containing protein, partial [Pyrinomonadaceae bacterium]|nr:DUF2339 domain-containing protein [Pyrinomonadaceae bacterium]